MKTPFSWQLISVRERKEHCYIKHYEISSHFVEIISIKYLNFNLLALSVLKCTSYTFCRCSSSFLSYAIIEIEIKLLYVILKRSTFLLNILQ